MLEISSNYMLNRVRKEIRKSEEDMELLKGVYMCGRTVASFSSSAVTVVSNGKDTKFVGVSFCHNVWCCPRCSAKEMSKHSRKISAIVDYFKERSIHPIMLTFTMPHTRYMPLRTSIDVLYATWREFRKRARPSKERDRACRQDIFAKFCRLVQSKDMIRATEVTFGRHGWHPHFHVLLFCAVKPDSAELFDLEKEMRVRWQKLLEKYLAKYYVPKYSKDKLLGARTFAKRLCHFADWEAHPGIFISRDDNGEPIYGANFADYVCGFENETAWNINKELTGSRFKFARASDSVTIAQLLHAAVYKNDQNAMDRFMEFARTMKAARHARINYSPGLNTISKIQMNTRVYRETLLKKFEARAKWREICWFSKSDWKEILRFDSDCPILVAIAYWATKADGLKRINGFLKTAGLPIGRTGGIQTEAILKLLNEAPPPFKIPENAAA